MTRAEPQPTTWWFARRWMWIAVSLFFWIALGGVVYVLLADDVPRGTLISACANPVVASCAWVTLRQRTQAGADGLRIVGPLRTHRITWAEVAEVATSRTRWGEGWVQVVLVDGTNFQPIGVPASAAGQLEQMRQRALA